MAWGTLFGVDPVPGGPGQGGRHTDEVRSATCVYLYPPMMWSSHHWGAEPSS